MTELLKASRTSAGNLGRKIKEQQQKCDEVRKSSEQLKEIIKQFKFKTNTRADVICSKLHRKLSESKK